MSIIPTVTPEVLGYTRLGPSDYLTLAQARMAAKIAEVRGFCHVWDTGIELWVRESAREKGRVRPTLLTHVTRVVLALVVPFVGSACGVVGAPPRACVPEVHEGDVIRVHILAANVPDGGYTFAPDTYATAGHPCGAVDGLDVGTSFDVTLADPTASPLCQRQQLHLTSPGIPNVVMDESQPLVLALNISTAVGYRSSRATLAGTCDVAYGVDIVSLEGNPFAAPTLGSRPTVVTTRAILNDRSTCTLGPWSLPTAPADCGDSWVVQLELLSRLP